MRRPAMLFFWVLLVCTAGFLFSLGGCGGGGASISTTLPPPGKIQHVVVIFQENRTPDNLFQDPNLIAKGADIVQSGMNSLGHTIPLTPITLANGYDLSHAHPAFVKMYDGGKMDGADLITCFPGTTGCPANPQFMFVNPSEVTPYFQLAEQYTFADRMFQTNQGPSFPAHQFIISGTSAPAVGSTSFAAENPSNAGGQATGCTSPPTEYVKLIDPSGSESTQVFPCFEHPTLTDLLNVKNVTWRYYAPS